LTGGWSSSLSISVEACDTLTEFGEEAVHRKRGVEFAGGAFTLDDGREQDGKIGGKHESVATEHVEEPNKDAGKFDVLQHCLGNWAKELVEIGGKSLSINVSCPAADGDDGVPERCTVANEHGAQQADERVAHLVTHVSNLTEIAEAEPLVGQGDEVPGMRVRMADLI
jgi:hypothetical protein